MNRVLASFTKSEKSIIAFVLALVAVGYGILDYQDRQREVTVFQVGENPDPAELPASAVMPAGVTTGGLIDLNTADQSVLETLPGVGPAMAARILQHRTTHGPFRSMSDLDAVSGIGSSVMSKLAPLVTFGETPAAATPATPDVAISPPANSAPSAIPVMAIAAASTPNANNAYLSAPSPTAVSAAAPVNINTASIEELDTLNGIGPALAERIIIDRRSLGPYRSVESLMRVKGIGPAILRKNRGRIVIQ